MKKILTLIVALVLCSFFSPTNAIEIKVSGKGYAPLTGYNIKAVRDMQNSKMDRKAKNSNFEVLQTQQIKEATRQAETRKKQDARLSAAVREQVVKQAEYNAMRAAINNLLDTVLGAGISKTPEVQSKFEAIISQLDVYVKDKEISGDVEDNNYVATVNLIVDEMQFRNHIRKMGAATKLANAQTHKILIVMDEFFERPSDLNTNVLKKEVTTYEYDYDENLKDHEKASASNYVKSNSSGASSNTYNVNSRSKGNYNSSASGGYSNAYGSGGYLVSASKSYNNSYKSCGSNSNRYNNSSSRGSSTSYGHFVDYSKKENEFFQNVKEYDVTFPKTDDDQVTMKALQGVFAEYKINTVDPMVFKNKYFKGKQITSKELSNSAELAKYVEAARTDSQSNADFIAIGYSRITDNGKNPNTGQTQCFGNVVITVFSTIDSSLIAAGNIDDIASGISSDDARAKVASKIGKALGAEITRKIQDYYADGMMNGFGYNVKIKGNFTPMESVNVYETLENMNGLKALEERESNDNEMVYFVKYAGKNIRGDIIKCLNSINPAKFQTYKVDRKSNTLIFYPANQKGIQNL